MNSIAPEPARAGWPIPEMLAARAETMRAWLGEPFGKRIGIQLAVICIGAGCYGATLGMWRSPLQAFYVALKFPLILLLVATCNAFLNGMLAQLLGLPIRFRDSFRLILIAIATASAILGGFAPLTFFALLNSPPLDDTASATRLTYSSIQLMHVSAIAIAGIMANAKLYQTLGALAGSRKHAAIILIAWLAGNLLLGSQLVWIFRPFIGAPFLPVEFLRDSAFEGNFFESVFYAIRHIGS